MRGKPLIVGLAVASGLLLWNLKEIDSSLSPRSEGTRPPIPDEVSLPELQWDWFNGVGVETAGSVATLRSLPASLEQLEGRRVIVRGSSFACGEDLVYREDGYTINGFVLVPYFGMIDCCVGNPIPYFQWTIVVKDLVEPWKINHTGIIDPSAVVVGDLRIEHGATGEGIFFLDRAKVLVSAEKSSS